jgi:hypothetical protein
VAVSCDALSGEQPECVTDVSGFPQPPCQVRGEEGMGGGDASWPHKC